MEDIRDSTTMPQIMKIVRMVVKFHPLLAVTSLIFEVIFLQDWIEKEVRALLDLVTKKMKNLSKALQMHLCNEAAKGQLKVKLIGKVALFSAAFLLLDTEFSSKYDKRGTQMQFLLLIGLDLLTHSKLWSQFKILRGRCGCIENSTSNFTFFVLALVFTKFYDNSLRSLSSMLCIAVCLLCVLVVLRPRTDLGLFSFIIGVIGSITYNRFKLKFLTWIIASICFVLFSFKSWLDKYWLNLEQDLSTNTIARTTNVLLILSSTVIHAAQAFLSFSTIKSPMSNYKDYLVVAISSMIWGFQLYRFYPKDNSLPSTDTKGINGLISIIVNVGVFGCVFILSLMVNYKYGLFVLISYVVYLFCLRRILLKDLSQPTTNTKGATGMILSLQSIATCDIAVTRGFEPLNLSNWLIGGICYLLWWVRLRIVISQRSGSTD